MVFLILIFSCKVKVSFYYDTYISLLFSDSERKKSTLRRAFVSSIRQNKSLTVTFVETVNNNKPQKDIKYLLCRRGIKVLNLISGAGALRHSFQAVDTGC